MLLHSKKVAIISVFSALAVAIYVIETFIPRPLPWLKFGFGNIIVLLTFYLLGFRFALLVTLLKSILGSLIIGNFFTPSFLFSISGGLVSLCVMAVPLFLFPHLFSPLGISILGAVSHNLTQLLTASFVFIGRIEVFHLTPIFLMLSLVTGTITGIVSLFILKALMLHGVAYSSFLKITPYPKP